MRNRMRLPSWAQGADRVVLGAVAGGGLTLGAVLLLLPAATGSPRVVGLVALVVGLAALTARLFDHPGPVPFLHSIPVLAAAVAPLLDHGMLIALNGILVSVLATGILIARSDRQAWGLTLLVLAAAASGFVSDAVRATSGLHAADWIASAAVFGGVIVVFRGLRESLMRRDEHQEEMDRFVSAVAHQLRTPLTGVIGFADTLSRSLDDPDHADQARLVASLAWDMARCVDDLIVVARDSASSLDVLRDDVPLAPLVRSVLDELGMAEHIEYMDVHGVAVGDRERIAQIIRHLVSNAVEHGGPRVWISSQALGDRVALRVHDDGPTVSKEALDSYLEPYRSGNAARGVPGRGVGLTVSRILARSMRGELTLESSHQGTTAQLLLPADPGAVDPSRVGVLENSRARLKERWTAPGS